jgi:hypothetical protein
MGIFWWLIKMTWLQTKGWCTRWSVRYLSRDDFFWGDNVESFWCVSFWRDDSLWCEPRRRNDSPERSSLEYVSFRCATALHHYLREMSMVVMALVLAVVVFSRDLSLPKRSNIRPCDLSSCLSLPSCDSPSSDSSSCDSSSSLLRSF